MLVPVVTADLAEKALPGAAAHALAVRAMTQPETAAADLAAFRSMHSAQEMVLSTSAYAVGLVWWFSVNRWRRGDLLEEAKSLLLGSVDDDDAPMVGGYAVYISQLSREALRPVAHAAELDLGPLVHGVSEIDQLTATFADAAVHALLLAGHEIFGAPDHSAEAMRDTMTTIAYSSAA
jgi:hypothetical protein